jgi:hypothetical protein
LSLWREDGLPTVWPVFLAAQVAGVFAAALAGPVVALVFMGLGVITAAACGTLAGGTEGACAGAGGAGGVVAMMTAFEGHGLFELPVFTHLGLFFGANLATALAAGVSNLALCGSRRDGCASAGAWWRLGSGRS